MREVGKANLEIEICDGLCINAAAPVRICDIGGWTDTWFSRFGKVFNIAVSPFVEVQVQVNRSDGSGIVAIGAENFRDQYTLDPAGGHYIKHPLLEAVIQAMELPTGHDLSINIFSHAPPGAAAGTSAAVTVALIGALDVLTPGRLTTLEIARFAHQIETEKLGYQSGVQDQIASAFGGVNLIDIYKYPFTSVHPIDLSDGLRWELGQRFVVIYIGKPHRSSEIHESVIDTLGSEAHKDPCIRKLRRLAVEARDAVIGGRLQELGRIMDENTAVQRDLHPGLVCEDFEEIISIARDFGVIGCKVNGAGGDGGSMTLLTSADMSGKRKMLKVLKDRGYQNLHVLLARKGLRVWHSPTG